MISSSSSTIQVTWHFEESNPDKINNQNEKQSRAIENNQQDQQQSNSSTPTISSVAEASSLPILAYVLHFKLQNSDIAQWQELR